MGAREELFESVFTNEFDINTFTTFSKEFFNDLEVIRPDKFMDDSWNWSEFNYYIKGYYHIGKFVGSDKKKVGIFSVKLKDYKNIDSARSMQRNFVKKLMNSGNLDGAIVAFYAEDESKWRLSFIRLDFEFAKGKGIEKITPAKRYSYLVGKGEPCHTAKERLYPIFQNIKDNLTLDEIEDAFSVEKVTKEFFEKYKEKYFEVKDHLEANEDFINEAERHNFTAEQFAKKLMGQIAFLYFIQKKGWLGVNAIPKTLTDKEYKDAYYSQGKASKEIIPIVYKQVSEHEFRLAAISNLSNDEEIILSKSVRGMPWGTGPKDFMRKLFETCTEKGMNYFDDYLEPLFYEALNENRGDSGYFTKLHCRVPFLNGGLFEPLDNYDWNNNDFRLENEIFSNKNIKGDRDADGILDIFDRYNFTMNEDEPLEREVAIDPEMLGKIFENLLDAKDRKSKGAFYTPRDIVHYMCQESIANYLVNKTGIPHHDIKDFIIYGEFMKDEDTSYQAKKGISDMLISNKIYDSKNRINRLIEIDNALADIKVADPAVGSGAFPLGMISEIVKIRKNISAYIALDMNDYQKSEMYRQYRHPLKLKLDTIKNSIFAVDIEASAVDITKLRLWLSLVVEQQTNENCDNMLDMEQKNPMPLPNLDCNIRCGNSLIDEFEGIKLINESDIFGAKSGTQVIMGQNQYDYLLTQLFDAQDKLFYEKNHQTKEELKKKIRSIIDTIVMFSIRENPETVEKYNMIKNNPSLQFFLWQLEFARVFKEKGGFDIVIGNPPYGLINKKQNQNTSIFATENEQKYYKMNPMYEPAKGGMINIYRLFVCLSYALLKKDGNFSLIFPMAYMCDLSAANLRKYIFNNAKTLYIEAFPERDNEKKRVFEAVKMSVCILGVGKCSTDNDRFYMRINHDRYVDVSQPCTNITCSALKKIDPIGMTIPLVSQQEFDIFVKITHDCKRLGDISKCYTGEIDLSLDKRYISMNENDAIMIRGAQVQKYRITNDISQGDILYLDGDKYLHANNSAKSKHHKSRRILMQGITGVNEKVRLKMTLVDSGIFCANSVNYILPNNDFAPIEFILGLLNSRLINWFFAKLSTNSNVNGYEIDNLPIKINDTIDMITDLVIEIINRKKLSFDADTSDLEAQIDKFVYKIYGLNDEEIRIIEGD